MQSTAATVLEYLESLPEDRKKAMINIRKVIRKNLPKGFDECMNYGMIGYVVPHKLYPAGYHANPKQPLPFISLASQKNFISFYHMALYEGKLLNWFKEEWTAHTQQKLDMGKCCVRLKKLEDIPLELMGELCTKLTAQQWIEAYENQLKSSNKKI